MDRQTTVLICEGLERLGNGLDLQAIERWLTDRAPEVDIRRAAGPCEKPGSLLDSCSLGSNGLVLALCGSVNKQELQAHVRKRGRDPFGAEVLNLGAYCARVHPRGEATEKAKVLLGAAIARARAFRGTRPENVKPALSWDQQVSRRALFTLPPIRYEVVPSVSEERCAARDTECQVCVVTCSRGGIVRANGAGLSIDKTRCTGCGACVSACPKIAMDLPGFSPSQLEAQLAALLDAPPASIVPRGIVFVCQRSASSLEQLARQGLSYPAGWFPVEVPCIGMVTPAWLLESLSLGASAVGVLLCNQDDCRFGRAEVIRGRVGYTRAVLDLLGVSPDRVRLLNRVDPSELAEALAFLPEPLKVPRRAHRDGAPLFTSRAGARALLGLAEAAGARLDRRLTHAYSPFGVVELADGCTSCGACVQACPTGALTLDRDRHRLALTFEGDHCIACGECATVCPEKVLAVKSETDLQRLSRGKLVIHRDREARCEACGGPITSHEMLEKIRALLGDHQALPTITRYCLSCRGVASPGRTH